MVRFPYTSLDVDRVRTLSGRRWHPDMKAEGKPWSCEVSEANLRLLRGWGFSVDPACDRAAKQPGVLLVEPIVHIPGFKGELMPFQQVGVGFLQAKQGRAILGDDMGLGKTVQALAWLQLNPNALPAVVVCPASLKGNWEEEVHKFTPLEVDVLSGSCPGVPIAAHRRGVVSIINYDVLGPWVDRLIKTHHTLIIDECQAIKNAKTQRTKATQKLAAGMQNVLALSGTPILNRPVEFFTALNLVAPKQFSNYWAYAQRYCAPRNNGFGWDFTGASNTEELHAKLKGVMIRRLKKEVLKDLPEKRQVTVPLELNGALKRYEAALEEVYGKWEEEEKPNPLSDITKIEFLRQAAVEAKMELVEEWIETFLDGSSDKLVAFTIHHSTNDRLKELFKGKVLVLDGRVPVAERQGIVKRFAEDPDMRLLVANIQVGGKGFNMTCARTAIFIEYPWTPGETAQVEDRIHRIGQDRGTIIYYLVAKGTLEEDMIELLNEKRKVLDAVLDGKIETAGSDNIQLLLVNRIKGKRK